MRNILIILILLIAFDISAQTDIKLSENIILDNEGSTELVDFLGIKYKEIRLSGKTLVGKTLSIKSYQYYEKSIISSDVVFPNRNVIMENYGKLNDSVFSFRVFIRLNDNQTVIKTRASFLNSTVVKNIPIYSNSNINDMDKGITLVAKSKAIASPTDLFKIKSHFYCVVEYNSDLQESMEIYSFEGNPKIDLFNDDENDRQLLIFEFTLE